ncbi:MAG: AAA family ATPase [Thainema sp.]
MVGTLIEKSAICRNMTHQEILPNRLRLSEAGRKQIDSVLKRLGWGKQSPAWAAQANVSISTLKRFRSRQYLKLEVFQSICDPLGLSWKDLAELTTTGEAEDSDTIWVGRREIVDQLAKDIKQCRLLIVTGITGIGKTALVDYVTRPIRSEYSYIITLNFESEPYLQFADAALDILRKMSQLETEEEQNQPEKLLGRCIQLLADNKCLIIIDSLEQILEGDEITGWSNFYDPLWESFFHRLLGKDICHSRVIITTQDLPQAVWIYGQRYDSRFSHIPLKGLSTSEQVLFFQKHGFEFRSNSLEHQYFVRIGAVYEGHPLALRVVSGDIWMNFDGEVSAYWQQYHEKIEAVERQHEELEIDRYSRNLHMLVRLRIDESLSRLSRDIHDAYFLACLVSVYREPFTNEFLFKSIEEFGFSYEKYEKCLNTLLDRSLLEITHDCYIRQHNLIRSVAKDHLENSEIEEFD